MKQVIKLGVTGALMGYFTMVMLFGIMGLTIVWASDDICSKPVGINATGIFDVIGIYIVATIVIGWVTGLIIDALFSMVGHMHKKRSVKH